MSDPTCERVFQNNIMAHLVANGWQQGSAQGYDRTLALYTRDVLDFVQQTQPREWQKLQRIYSKDTAQHFLKHLTQQLAPPAGVSPQAARRYGTLGVLRHQVNMRGVRFSLCAFKPDHQLNANTFMRYQQNICRVVPEVIYRPLASAAAVDKATGQQAKAYRIDLVLFVNGLPVATLELKSTFKQTVQDAIKQYKTTRLPIDATTQKPEPLLTFKRGALVHFAVSQEEVFMCTQLDGANSFFLPFNQGREDGGAGNDTPKDSTQYATHYLWDRVLATSAWLKILGRFLHLDIEEKKDDNGRTYKQERMIFPRYHQWDVVNALVHDTLHANAAPVFGAAQCRIWQI